MALRYILYSNLRPRTPRSKCMIGRLFYIAGIKQNKVSDVKILSRDAALTLSDVKNHRAIRYSYCNNIEGCKILWDDILLTSVDKLHTIAR